MEYNNNYFKMSLNTYPPKLKMYRSVLMLTPEDRNEVALLTNDSALRLYEYYIAKKGWHHFNPTNYKAIGADLAWSEAKTIKNKAKLVKAGLLAIIKDTLNDKTVLYRVLLGLDMVAKYKKTGEIPELAGTIDSEEVMPTKPKPTTTTKKTFLSVTKADVIESSGDE